MGGAQQCCFHRFKRGFAFVSLSLCFISTGEDRDSKADEARPLRRSDSKPEEGGRDLQTSTGGRKFQFLVSERSEHRIQWGRGCSVCGGVQCTQERFTTFELGFRDQPSAPSGSGKLREWEEEKDCWAEGARGTKAQSAQVEGGDNSLSRAGAVIS